MTVQPDPNIVNEYVQQMSDELLGNTNEIWLIGKMTAHLEIKNLNSRITAFKSIDDLVAAI